MSLQDQTFKKINKQYTPLSFFANPKDEAEFFDYWKRYSKRMIEAQDPSLVKKVSRLFKSIEKEKNDDLFVKDLEIKKVNDLIGWGVFAKRKIPKKTILTHYAGIIKKDRQVSNKNRHVFGFTGTEKLKNWVIDSESVTNMGSLINHSKNGNVEAMEYYDKKGPKIVFETIRDIEKGEELTYDYGEGYWKGLKEKPR
ncbi:MAG: hypothetical protein COT84_02130 [Chlamydiae bacterium CG10_big_fil_rev_8_21_14_0_10_35_9]|nr:MAG: hypothetical protein COT84_02130 [Chlamydiae bacterium CG10_big_fil_rev_8_21_14_0_10_35_9]